MVELTEDQKKYIKVLSSAGISASEAGYRLQKLSIECSKLRHPFSEMMKQLNKKIEEITKPLN